MAERENHAGLLSPFRVLDLTDELGFLCGKILGDLGADVIKVEKPGGDPARKIGPFFHDQPEPEKSIFRLTVHYPPDSVDKVLEIPAGAAKAYGIASGTILSIEN